MNSVNVNFKVGFIRDLKNWKSTFYTHYTVDYWIDTEVPTEALMTFYRCQFINLIPCKNLCFWYFDSDK